MEKVKANLINKISRKVNPDLIFDEGEPVEELN